MFALYCTLYSGEFSPLTFVSLLFQTSMNAVLIMVGVTTPAPTVPAPSAAVVTQGSPWKAMGKLATVGYRHAYFSLSYVLS